MLQINVRVCGLLQCLVFKFTRKSCIHKNFQPHFGIALIQFALPLIKAPFTVSTVRVFHHIHSICGRMREMPILVKIFISTHFRFKNNERYKNFSSHFISLFLWYFYSPKVLGEFTFLNSKRFPFRCTGGIPFHRRIKCVWENPFKQQIHEMRANKASFQNPFIWCSYKSKIPSDFH